MKRLGIICSLALLISLAACGTYSTSSMNEAPGASIGQTTVAHKTPEQIMLTENDILNRKYKSLGDISVTVRKVTIFDKDPNKETVNQALKEKAAEIGADAVVLVRYGTVGIGVFSWGVMDGNGRAIVFEK